MRKLIGFILAAAFLISGFAETYASNGGGFGYRQTFLFGGDPFYAYYDPAVTKMYQSDDGVFNIENSKSVKADTYTSAYAVSESFTLEKGVYRLSLKVKPPKNFTTNWYLFAALNVLDEFGEYPDPPVKRGLISRKFEDGWYTIVLEYTVADPKNSTSIWLTSFDKGVCQFKEITLEKVQKGARDKTKPITVGFYIIEKGVMPQNYRIDKALATIMDDYVKTMKDFYGLDVVCVTKRVISEKMYNETDVFYNDNEEAYLVNGIAENFIDDEFDFKYAMFYRNFTYAKEGLIVNGVHPGDVYNISYIGCDMNRDITKELLYALIHEITHGFEYAKVNGPYNGEYHDYLFGNYVTWSQGELLKLTREYVKANISESVVEAALYRSASVKVLLSKKFYD